MEQVKVTITVKSPTLIANSSTAGVLTATRGSMDGRILRGIFASQFINSHNLGKEAHKNQEFMDLFYGDLRFVSAYKDTVKGTSFPAPLSLQKCKNAEGYKSDDVVDFYTGKDLLGFKGIKGFIVQDGKECSQVQIETAIKLHMSRSLEQERVQGRSKEGNIFNYEYLEPNQVFVGAIIGPKESLETFVRQFPKALDCYIGRSRRTEYGHCVVEIGDVETVPSPVCNGNSVYVRLHTPLLLGNESIATVVNRSVEIIGTDISLGAIFASYQEEQNFNSIWGVRSTSESAASAGGTIELVKASGWTQDDLAKLQDLLYNGMGTRLQEGYGQGRLWMPGEFKMVKLGKANPTKITSLHTSTQGIAKKVLEKQVILNARLRAAHDVNTYIKRTMQTKSISRHFASVLLAELGTKHDCGHKQLQAFVAQTKEDKKVLEKNLREFHLDHAYTTSETKRVNLMDYIIDFDPNALVSACLAKSGESGTYYEIPAELVDMVGINKHKLSNIVAYEYWTYFFRHIRKIK